MAETNYEEATRCPQCSKPGEVTIRRDAPPNTGLPRGTQFHTVTCKHELCPWYNTVWVVQVNEDGTIPEPKDHTFDQKTYVGFEGHEEEALRILQSIRQTQELSTQEHSEINNPFSR